MQTLCNESCDSEINSRRPASHRARLTAGRRAHVVKNRQLRTIVASIPAADERLVDGKLAVTSDRRSQWQSLCPLSSRLATLMGPGGARVERCSPLSSGRASCASTNPASVLRISVAADATSFSAGGGELARSSLHLNHITRASEYE